MIDFDFDIDDIMSPKSLNIGLIDTFPILTKSELNHFETNMSAEKVKQILGNKKLNIICADDTYFNLEALRIVFQNIGLIEYCHFVSNGK